MPGILKNIPFVRGFKYQTPPYHVGSVLENRLGLQVFRTLSKYVLWKTRPSYLTEEIRNFVRILEQDGILIIEDFLTQKDFEQVLTEFNTASDDAPLLPYKGDESGKLYRKQIRVSDDPTKFPSIIRCLQENKSLQAIASAITRRKMRQSPNVHLDVYKTTINDGFDNDIENILHADLHTPTVKMFLYLNEVGHSNGAFVYAKKSQKLTFARLRHEYELSIREAKLAKGATIPDSMLSYRGNEVRNIVHPKHFANMEVAETQICVKPNTLVIANNMGFHRRGEFLSDTTRKVIVLNFRQLERPVL